MNINILVERMLKDKKLEKKVYCMCNSSEGDYFPNHYDGNISEHMLFDYCIHAKRNRYATDILKQIIRYCDVESLSSRVLLELSKLPRKDSETCYHYLAHCPLSFFQKYSVFLKYRSSERLIDLLDYMCLEEWFVEDDIRYLLTYVTIENVDVIRYFVGTFDETANINIKRKIAVINSWITENSEDL